MLFFYCMFHICFVFVFFISCETHGRGTDNFPLVLFAYCLPNLLLSGVVSDVSTSSCDLTSDGVSSFAFFFLL